jgi:hypothetical protein
MLFQTMKTPTRMGILGFFLALNALWCGADTAPATAQYGAEVPVPAAPRRVVPKVFRPLQVGTLVLLNGVKYTDAVVTAESPLHVTVRHASGVAQIEKGKLPDELYQRFPPDEDTAARDAARAEQLRERAELDRQRLAQSARIRQQETASRTAAAAAEQENAALRQASQLEAIRGRAASAFYDHFRRNWKPGSNAIYITRLQLNVSEIEPSPGWEGSYNVKGHVDMEYYLSPGRTFNSMTRDFSGTYTERAGKREVSLDLR